jgi:hypothetical protein
MPAVKARTLLSLFVALPILWIAAPSHCSDPASETAPSMSPTQAARITSACSLWLSDVDPSGHATLTFSYRVGEAFQGRSVRIDLLTGKLLPPADLTAARKRPGPSDRYTLSHADGAGSPILIKTKQGREVGRITGKDAPFLVSSESCEVAWSPTDDIFAFAEIPGTDSVMDLRVYSVQDRKVRMLMKNAAGSPEWSPDGRYLVCLSQTSVGERIGRPSYDHGVVNVLDARHGFRQVLKTGTVADMPVISQSGSMIAFVDRARDEFGDLDTYVLRAADIGSGKVRTIATSRRSIKFLWAGGMIAVQTRDKYARPSLYLRSRDGARSVTLALDLDCYSLEPVVYVPKAHRIVYIAHKGNSSDDRPSELWAAEPGHKPVRLFPVKGRTER